VPNSDPRAPQGAGPATGIARAAARSLACSLACSLALAVSLAAVPSPARAQRPDSTRADSARADSARRRARPDSAAAAARPQRAARRVPTDTTPRPPITPRRAFLYSLAAPGLGQTRLGRPNAALIFATVEGIALLMTQKSALDLRAARFRASDSIVVGYQTNAAGEIVIDSATKLPVFEYGRANPLFERVSARRTHYEDWVALLLFNHFFAGADAFVAAQLWDVPVNVGFCPVPGGALLAATIRF